MLSLPLTPSRFSSLPFTYYCLLVYIFIYCMSSCNFWNIVITDALLALFTAITLEPKMAPATCRYSMLNKLKKKTIAYRLPWSCIREGQGRIYANYKECKKIKGIWCREYLHRSWKNWEAEQGALWDYHQQEATIIPTLRAHGKSYAIRVLDQCHVIEAETPGETAPASGVF